MHGIEDSNSIPSAFDFVLNQFPPGAEIVEFFSPEGRSYTGEELKAVERQERQQMEHQIQGVVPESIKSLLDQITGGNSVPKPKFIRQVRKCFHFGDSFIALANDDTIWHFMREKEDGYWKQLENAFVPALPQDGAF